MESCLASDAGKDEVEWMFLLHVRRSRVCYALMYYDITCIYIYIYIYIYQ
jgi:hypothetical protein